VHAVLGEAMAAGGDLARGRTEIARSVELMHDQGEHVHRAEALRLLGWATWKLGDADAGRELLEQAVALAAAQGARSWQLRALTTLAEFRLEVGDASNELAALGSLFASFTEGAETADHVRAAALLDGAAARFTTTGGPG